VDGGGQRVTRPADWFRFDAHLDLRDVDRKNNCGIGRSEDGEPLTGFARTPTSRRAIATLNASGFKQHIGWRCCAAHFGVSRSSLLVAGVFAVTADPPLSVNT